MYFTTVAKNGNNIYLFDINLVIVYMLFLFVINK